MRAKMLSSNLKRAIVMGVGLAISFIVVVIIAIAVIKLSPLWCTRIYTDAILPHAKVMLGGILIIGILVSVIYSAIEGFIESKSEETISMPEIIFQKLGERFFLLLASVLFIDAGLKIILLVIEKHIPLDRVIETAITTMVGVTFIALHRGLEPFLGKDKFELSGDHRNYITLYILVAMNLVLLTGLVLVKKLLL